MPHYRAATSWLQSAADGLHIRGSHGAGHQWCNRAIGRKYWHSGSGRQQHVIRAAGQVAPPVGVAAGQLVAVQNKPALPTSLSTAPSDASGPALPATTVYTVVAPAITVGVPLVLVIDSKAWRFMETGAAALVSARTRVLVVIRPTAWWVYGGGEKAKLLPALAVNARVITPPAANDDVAPKLKRSVGSTAVPPAVGKKSSICTSVARPVAKLRKTMVYRAVRPRTVVGLVVIF